MKKHLFLLVCIALFAGLLPAQKDDFPAVIIASQGKVRYLPADNSGEIKITSGMAVKKTGTIKITGGGSAVVFCNNRMQRLNGKGRYALPEVFKPGGMATLNFEPEFGKYVRASIEFAASKQAGDGWGTGVTDPKQAGDGWGSAVTDPKQAGDGWGSAVTDPKQAGDGWGSAVTDPKQAGDGWGNAVTDPKQAGDGWGGTGANIVLILPFGKLTPDVVTFAWSKPAGANTYQLEILDENSKSMHSVTVADTFAAVDLRKLNLTPNQVYSWKVSVPGSDKMISSVREFTLSTPDAQAAAMKRAASSPVYRNSGPVVRGMMEAVALEKGEWYTAAGLLYETLLRQNRKDKMLRMMCAAFWMRYGLEPKAKAAMQ